MCLANEPTSDAFGILLTSSERKTRALGLKRRATLVGIIVTQKFFDVTSGFCGWTMDEECQVEPHLFSIFKAQTQVSRLFQSFSSCRNREAILTPKTYSYKALGVSL